MNWKADFRRGKRAGKKHQNSHDADLTRIREEQNQMMNEQKNQLVKRKAEVDHQLQEISASLDLIHQFLREAEGIG